MGMLRSPQRALYELQEEPHDIQGGEVNLDLLKGWLKEHDFEDSVYFTDPDHNTAILGVSQDGRVIYDYSLMVDYLEDTLNFGHQEAIDFLEVNVMGVVQNLGDNAPIIMDSIEAILPDDY